ncbi:MAG: caspase family protein [Verrucomicrobia bacterium]|nr:caspase family protein [Cytophagales bacterium]
MKKYLFLLCFVLLGLSLKAQDYTLTGDEKMKKGDFAGAVNDYKNAFRKDNSTQNALRLGKAYFYQKEYNMAEVYISKATIETTNKNISSDAFLYRGLTRINRNKKVSGFYDLQKALQIRPENAEVYRQRGLMQMKEKNYVMAVYDFNAFAMYAPKSWETYNSLAEEIVKSDVKNYDLIGKAQDFAQISVAIQKNTANQKTLALVAEQLKRVTAPALAITVSSVTRDNETKTEPKKPEIPKTEPKKEEKPKIENKKPERKDIVVSDNDLSSIDLEKFRKKAKVWAVIVGVSKYAKDPQLNLKYADADAVLFDQFLRSPAGGSIPTERIMLLTNEKATSKAVIQAMKQIYARASEEDVVILYVASHGATEGKEKEFYFLTTDAEVGKLNQTSLSRKQVAEGFQNCRAKKKMIFADACHSANLLKADIETSETNEENTNVGAKEKSKSKKPEKGARGIESEQGNPAPSTEVFSEASGQLETANKLLVEMAQANEGYAIMTASNGGQKSYEDIKWGGGHGIFTHTLIEGLKGKADEDKNKFVSFDELHLFVFQNVTQATSRKQQPLFQGTFDGNFPMSVVVK